MNGSTIADLRAFAKLYGYVRHFHPSDEAAGIDWDRFAVHGVGRARRAKSGVEFKRVLEELFQPIAPTVRLFAGRPRRPEKPECPPAVGKRGPVVAWQHRGVTGSSQSPGIYRSVRTNRVTVIRDERGRAHRFSEPIFKAMPRLGEATVRPLGNGLWCRVPLALTSVHGGTWGPASQHALERLCRSLRRIGVRSLSARRLDVRLAGVVITWNVLQHFYPYFGEVRVDWQAVLSDSLRRAFRDRTPEHFRTTLNIMLERTGDGHASAHLKGGRGESGVVPFATDWIQGQLVVTWAAEGLKVQRGDVVPSIDGEPSSRVLRRAEREARGSAQLKRWKALRWGWWWGPRGSTIRIGVKRGTHKFKTRTARTMPDRPQEPRKYQPIKELAPGTWYVDLTRAKWASIERAIRTVARARGVILDLRGYPSEWNVTINILRHLLKRGNTSASWYRTPMRIYPDQERPVGYEPGGWSWLKPTAPRIRGRVVLLTDAGTWSQGECIVGFFAPYRLGTVIGQTTAGSNGDVAEFSLPGGFEVCWTGARVVKHDGSRFHMFGFRPDIRVERTLEGIRNGRDEFVERAVQMMGGRGGIS